MLSTDDKKTLFQLYVRSVSSWCVTRHWALWPQEYQPICVSCFAWQVLRSWPKHLYLTYQRTSVILYYDHALTLPAEIQRVWIRGSLTWPTLLFFVNRYLAFFGHFPVILQSFWNSSDLPHKLAVSILSYAIEQHLRVFSPDVSPLVLPKHPS